MAGIKVSPLSMVHVLRALHANLEIDEDGQMVATWQVKPILTEQIKAATQNDDKYVKLMEEARDGKKPKLLVNDEGFLLHKGKMCIPDNIELRQTILKETHDSPFAMHSCGTKMYRNMKEHYWWRGMKKDITEYVPKCLTCQQVKAKH